MGAKWENHYLLAIEYTYNCCCIDYVGGWAGKIWLLCDASDLQFVDSIGFSAVDNDLMFYSARKEEFQNT